MSFDSMWEALGQIGRDGSTGGYHRYAWTSEDGALREWFTGECGARGLDVTTDRAGNQWGWWGMSGGPVAGGVVTGSHLDSVPAGGAFDGALGVVSAFAALDLLRCQGFRPTRPIGVVNFADEEGARFGVACTGSRLLTGALDARRACGLTDADGVSLGEAMTRAGHLAGAVGRDEEALRRIGVFVELHIEQGRALVDRDASVAVGSSIWPHGRWRLELAGEANHAGTTRLVDRRDPMLTLAAVIAASRWEAERRGCLATVGKVRVEPNGINAIASHVTAWLDARGPDEGQVHALAHATGRAVRAGLIEESFTPATSFDAGLVRRLSGRLGGVPALSTGAGHDAGVLAQAGVASAMLFVRNPTGVSHSPVEFAERADCLAGIDALTAVLEELAG